MLVDLALMNTRVVTILVNPSTVVCYLCGIAAFLVLMSLVGQFAGLELGHDYLRGVVPMFNLDAEQNVPTFFSVLLLTASSSLLAIIAMISKKQNEPYVSKWWFLALGFIFMAFDEGFQVHEQLSTPFRTLLGSRSDGLLYFSWVVPAIILVCVIVVILLRFLFWLPRTSALRFLFSALLYLSGAVGVEMLGGSYAEYHGMHNWTYVLFYTVEETLELLGLIFFIWSLLKHIGLQCESVCIKT